VDSFAEGLQAFESACYRATDRLRLATRSSDELGWGHLVLLLAWDGKLGLILKRCEEQGEAPPAASWQADLTRLRASWAAYVEDFRQEVARELEAQFERSVVTRLRTVVSAPAALGTIEDLERLLDELDTIEVFLEAAERQFPGTDFRRRIDALKAETRTLIQQQAGPGLVSEYGPPLLAALNADWVPARYWWRHIEWGAPAGVSRAGER
jgi:hypothetical protein